MIKVISFDLDGSLADNAFDEQIWRRELPRLYAEDRGLDFESAYREVTAEYSRLFKAQEPRWRDVKFWLEHFKLKVNWEQIVLDLKHKIRVFGDVHPVLDSLSKKYKLVLVSTANHDFLNLKLDALDLRRHFDEVFSVQDFGEMKKTPELFKKIVSSLGIECSEIVHIGDKVVDDYDSPMAAGVRAFVIDRSGTDHSDRACLTLYQFAEKLEEM